jgi:hypothetical protein
MRRSTYLSCMSATEAPTIVTGVDFVSVPRTLEERGVSFMGDTFDTGVCHMAFFADPDGNMLMLHHRYEPRVPEN